jgi:flagellar basal body-associated protein FliL
MNIPDILSSMGINLGGGVLGIVIFIIIGLVASVFAAAFAALFMWIFNVILRITGGIELRFAPGTIASHQFTGNAKPEEKTANNAKKQAVLEEQASSEQNQISRVEDYNLGN